MKSGEEFPHNDNGKGRVCCSYYVWRYNGNIQWRRKRLLGTGCSAASENLLLAAHAMHLGAVWCGIYPQMTRVRQFSEMLRLPENIVPMACICVGYPAGETTPKDKWKPEYIHYNTWE